MKKTLLLAPVQLFPNHLRLTIISQSYMRQLLFYFFAVTTRSLNFVYILLRSTFNIVIIRKLVRLRKCVLAVRGWPHRHMWGLNKSILICSFLWFQEMETFLTLWRWESQNSAKTNPRIALKLASPKQLFYVILNNNRCISVK